MNRKKFVYPDPSGNAWGVVSTEQLWAHVYAIKFNRPEKRLDQSVWSDLFEQAKTAAIEFGAVSLQCRIRLEYEVTSFRELLQKLGFEKKAGRIEYQSEIEHLQPEAGTPFTWQTVKDLNWDFGQIVALTKEIIMGALDVDPNENPEEFIQDWLSHDELTSGGDCIAFGFFEGEPSALVVAQVKKETGWSRIS